MQLEYFLTHGARCWTGLAPTRTSTVIHAHPSVRRQETLYAQPVARESASACFENDSRTFVCRPNAIDVHLVSANINESSRRRTRWWRLGYRLRDRRKQSSQDQSDNCCCS